MTASFRGKRYSIVFAKLKKTDGICDHPTTKHKTIKIDKKLRGYTLIETIIHEGLHASFWDIEEEAIDQASKDIARFLCRATRDITK